MRCSVIVVCICTSNYVLSIQQHILFKNKNRAENQICIWQFHISQNSNSLTTKKKLKMKGIFLASSNTRDKRDVISLLKIISLLAYA